MPILERTHDSLIAGERRSVFPSGTARQRTVGLVALVAILGTYAFCLEEDVAFMYFLVLFVLVLAIVAVVNFEAALLTVPLSLMNPYTLSETGSRLHLSELVLLVVFTVWALRLISMGKRPIVPKSLFLPAAIILIAAIASYSNASYKNAALTQIIRYLEVFIIFFLLLVNECRTVAALNRILLFLVIGGFFASFVGIVQFLAGLMDGESVRRVFGWHGGGYGAVTGSTLFFCVAALLQKRRGVVRYWALVTLPFAAVALLLSQTRAWTWALFVVGAVLVARANRKVMIRMVWALICVVLVATIITQTDAFGLVPKGTMDQVIAGSFRFGGSDGKLKSGDLSLLMRLNVWRHAGSLFLAHPFVGVGVGNLRYENYFTAKLGDPGKEGVGYVDNQYVQFFVETGVFAGLAWLVFIARATRLGWKATKRPNVDPLFGPAIGCFASLLVFVVGMNFWVVTPSHELFAMLILNIALLWRISDIDAENITLETKGDAR